LFITIIYMVRTLLIQYWPVHDRDTTNYNTLVKYYTAVSLSIILLLLYFILFTNFYILDYF